MRKIECNQDQFLSSFIMDVVPLRFLVVDDDPIYLEIIRSIISANHPNSTVTCFQSCEEVLRHILNEISHGICNYDVAVLDMKLPKFDGRSLNALFKSKCPSAISILVTSGDLEFGVKELTSYKFDYGCSKSYMFEKSNSISNRSSIFTRSFEDIIRNIA